MSIDLVTESDLTSLFAACDNPLGGVDVSLAADVVDGIPIYDGSTLRACAAGADADAARAELAAVLERGPGVFAVRRAWPDRDVLRRATELFWTILQQESLIERSEDDWAAVGSNTRIWNSLGKMAAFDPQLHVEYHANPVLDLVCEAWLGPWYQLTSQVNVVHPGGEAQPMHRDYHLGLIGAEEVERFPAHVHRAAPSLTLQVAVAHSDMPLESGPTMVLPGSQRYEDGYRHWRDERIVAYFAEHHRQVALEEGDIVVFVPALFHAAGTNATTDVERFANIFQVSSAFGVPMERVDWPAVSRATYPSLLALAETEEIGPHHLAACAAGYAFPTSLDTDPVGASRVPPMSGQQMLATSLGARLTPSEFERRLDEHMARKRGPAPVGGTEFARD